MAHALHLGPSSFESTRAARARLAARVTGVSHADPNALAEICLSSSNDTQTLLDEALARVRAASELDALRALEREYLQKGGVVASLLASIPTLAPEQRKETGQRANQLKQAL